MSPNDGKVVTQSIRDARNDLTTRWKTVGQDLHWEGKSENCLPFSAFMSNEHPTLLEYFAPMPFPIAKWYVCRILSIIFSDSYSWLGKSTKQAQQMSQLLLQSLKMTSRTMLKDDVNEVILCTAKNTFDISYFWRAEVTPPTIRIQTSICFGLCSTSIHIDYKHPAQWPLKDPPYIQSGR